MNHTTKNLTRPTTLQQCVVCGYLDGALAKGRECTSKTGVHRFRPVDKGTLASALGATGGRPPTYKTEEERRLARLNTYRRANEKRRRKAVAEQDLPA